MRAGGGAMGAALLCHPLPTVGPKGTSPSPDPPLLTSAGAAGGTAAWPCSPTAAPSAAPSVSARGSPPRGRCRPLCLSAPDPPSHSSLWRRCRPAGSLWPLPSARCTFGTARWAPAAAGRTARGEAWRVSKWRMPISPPQKNPVLGWVCGFPIDKRPFIRPALIVPWVEEEVRCNRRRGCRGGALCFQVCTQHPERIRAPPGGSAALPLFAKCLHQMPAGDGLLCSGAALLQGDFKPIPLQCTEPGSQRRAALLLCLRSARPVQELTAPLCCVGMWGEASPCLRHKGLSRGAAERSCFLSSCPV